LVFDLFSHHVQPHLAFRRAPTSLIRIRASLLSFTCMPLVCFVLIDCLWFLWNKRELKQRRRGRQRERQKTVGLDWQSKNFPSASRFFVDQFFAVTARKTWNCLISCFVETVDTCSRQRFFFSFPELQALIQSCKHLSKWTRWNKRDKVQREFTFLSEMFVAIAFVVAQALLTVVSSHRTTINFVSLLRNDINDSCHQEASAVSTETFVSTIQLASSLVWVANKVTHM